MIEEQRVRLDRARLDELASVVIGETQLPELISQSWPLSKNDDGSYSGCCPFHQYASGESLCVTEDRFKCTECGFGGTAIGWAMYTQSLDITEAVVWLAGMLGIDTGAVISSDDLALAAARRRKLLSDVSSEWQKSLAVSEDALNFLLKRGIGRAIADEFQIGWCAHGQVKPGNRARNLWKNGVLVRTKSGEYAQQFSRRVMFPIRDIDGHVVGFGGRSLSDSSNAKYLNSKGSRFFDKRRLLYGLYESLRHSKRAPPRLILVEGYIDVISLHQAGFRCAVAALGTSLSTEQLSIALQKTEHLTYCFDEDANEAGKRATVKALRLALGLITPGQIVDVVELPMKHDPDSYIRKFGKRAFESLLRQATPIEVWLHRAILEECSAVSKGSTDPVMDSRDIGALARVAALSRETIDLIEAYDLEQRFRKLTEQTIGVELNA